MTNNDFTYHFQSSKTPHEIFELLLQIPQWWSGLYGETINGDSKKLNAEFSFDAGGGMHHSKQKLVEVVPDKKLVWVITDSNLSFLSDRSEWTGTKIHFDLATENNHTNITFVHEGLLPKMECYDNCSSAWTKYMERLQDKLK